MLFSMRWVIRCGMCVIARCCLSASREPSADPQLVALDKDLIGRVQQGIIINLKRSKTDQTSKGRQVAIPRGLCCWCPIWVLNTRFERSGTSDAAVFRFVNCHRAGSGNVRLQLRPSPSSLSNASRQSVLTRRHTPATACARRICDQRGSSATYPLGEFGSRPDILRMQCCNVTFAKRENCL